MARKTKSRIFKTYPMRSEGGDGEYWFGKDEHSVTPLPAELQRRLVVNSEVYFDLYMAAARHHPISVLEFEANFKAELHSRLSARWKALLEAYEVKDGSALAWKRMAMDLARDYIPGLSVEYVDVAKPAPRVMKREYIEGLINHVRKVMEELKASRSNRAAKVTESQALKAIWKKWPPELGRQRSNYKSFAVHYYQCKAAFMPKTLAELGSGNYKNGEAGL